MRSLAVLLVLSFCLALASASFEPASSAAGCSGKPNLSPIYDDAPQVPPPAPPNSTTNTIWSCLSLFVFFSIAFSHLV